MKAIFVTFEGMEGSGKSTQARAIEAYYSKQGKRVFATREPGGTVLGNELRALLLRSRTEPLDPLAELFLLEAARAQHITRILKEALANHDLVICDRYTDATLAYQGGGRGIDRNFLVAANEKASYGIRPDLTILLDLSVEEALKRALARISKDKGVPEDRFEREEKSFHERVRQGYLELAKQEPTRFLVIDAKSRRDEIEKIILKRIDSLLKSS